MIVVHDNHVKRIEKRDESVNENTMEKCLLDTL